MNPTQKNREAQIKTPLGDDVLLLSNMSMSEELGRLFNIELELLSTKEDIKFEDLLGQNVTVSLNLANDEKRYFNGIVSRFSQSMTQGGFAVYSATVKPWLWFLTRTSDCRIFQEKTVPDIIKEVFRDHGYTDVEEKLSGDYRTWEYCVQYRETDFNFVSRLMENEGIYYYFLHEDGKHTLVLSDSYSSHELINNHESIPFYPDDETAVRDEEYISSWYISKQVQPGIYSLNDYDFERPKANLNVNSSIQESHASSEFEIYDYPGEYIKSDDGDKYARSRIEELHSQFEQTQGQSDVREFGAGTLFKLTDYPRDDQNREYLITSMTHNIHSGDYQSSSDVLSEPVYSNTFTVIESETPFRSIRSTPKPVVQGPQTAIVVGAAGEDIYPDKYGRIKVQFHWDRYGKEDENSSCWVRVSQNRAGKGWGEMYIPHVGHEVIVSFLEGDPDRPIATGRLFNADNMPPLELPANKTKTAMRDHGGSEIIMEGDDGGQRITMFSPSGGSRFSMGAGFNPDPGFHWNTADNWSAIVEGWEKKDVTSYSKEWIGGTKSYTVDGTVTEDFKSDLNTTIAGSKTEKINGPYQWFKTGAEASINLSAVAKVVIGAEASANLSAKKSFTAGIDDSTFVGAKISKQAGFFTSVTAGRKLTVDLAGELNKKADEIKAVDSKIVVTSGGPSAYQAGGLMYLTGKPVEINGGGSVKISVGGSEIKVSSGMVMIEAGEIVLKGDVTISKNLVVNGKINDK